MIKIFTQLFLRKCIYYQTIYLLSTQGNVLGVNGDAPIDLEGA